jgi:hypothetical protein
MNVISTTVEYKGSPVKITNGRIFLRGFGTTIYNHSMHSHWIEVSVDGLKDEFKSFLKENNLI